MSLEHGSNRSFASYDVLDWAYRQCGYVFWDKRRLQTLGALTIPSKPAELPPQNHSSITYEEMGSSWREISDIYSRGGRVFWSKEDGAQLVWPQRKNIKTDHWLTYTTPESLVEAKEF
ncbi:hypothetical protein F4811DRAFT_555351 [Daldinia bambusicola]|nr:hypothetical protein F4811DRAFT_555351 [Daldinia bambusicola]